MVPTGYMVCPGMFLTFSIPPVYSLSLFPSLSDSHDWLHSVLFPRDFHRILIYIRLPFPHESNIPTDNLYYTAPRTPFFTESPRPPPTSTLHRPHLCFWWPRLFRNNITLPRFTAIEFRNLRDQLTVRTIGPSGRNSQCESTVAIDRVGLYSVYCCQRATIVVREE